MPGCVQRAGRDRQAFERGGEERYDIRAVSAFPGEGFAGKLQAIDGRGIERYPVVGVIGPRNVTDPVGAQPAKDRPGGHDGNREGGAGLGWAEGGGDRTRDSDDPGVAGRDYGGARLLW